MRCKSCGALVACKADKCPLCHAPIASDGEVAFPKPTIKPYVHKKLTLAYLIAAAVIVIACAVTNILTDTTFMWFVMVLVCLVYIYYAVKVTFLAQRGVHKRILGQTVMLTAIFFAIRIIFGGNHWIFITWLPIVYFVSDMLMFVYVVCKGNEAPKFVATLLLLCLLGCVPVICAYALNLSVKWPSIAATAVSGGIFSITLLIYRKNILSELKKVFHL